MRKTKEPNMKLLKEYQDAWQMYGGLVIAKDACKILNLTESHLSKHWKEINLEKTTVAGKKYIGLSSIVKEARKRENN